ncbi:MAG: TatD family hydrolase [Kiloniellales bacterium]
MLVDSHCHLDFPDFADDIDAVIDRADAAGVGLMVTISTKLSQFDRVLAVAERYPQLYCSVGIHPHESAAEAPADSARLVELSRHPKVVGIGETGLDYHYEHSPREAQKSSFRTHIEGAREAGLPLIVHTRDADQDTADLLHEAYREGPFTGLIHCFSTTKELAEKALEIGFYVSISGIITFKRSHELRAIVGGLPVGRLLVETDAPYLAPVPMRGKRNEPAFMVHTAAEVARLKGLELEQLARHTTRNFLRLFGKVEAPADAGG